MPRTSFEPLVYKTPGAKFVLGRFQLNTGANPDVLLGKGWTVARTAAGKYTVTLADKFHRLLCVVACFGRTGDNLDVGCHVEENDMTAAAQTFVVRTTAGAGTDTETDNTQVSFIAVVLDTTIADERSS